MWTHSINPLVFPQSVKEPLYCGCFLILVNLAPIESINLYLFHFVEQTLLCLETVKLSFRSCKLKTLLLSDFLRIFQDINLFLTVTTQLTVAHGGHHAFKYFVQNTQTKCEFNLI